MKDEGEDNPLHRYLETLEELREENRQLRQAAKSFGQLAERLNDALIRERRQREADRRREPRPEPDRRKNLHSQ